MDLGSHALACVTVTFHPEVLDLRAQLIALPEDAAKIIVDNGTPEVQWAEVALVLQEIPNLTVVRLGENRGLAAAINAGAHVAASQGKKWLLMLDQDSEPSAGSVETLLAAYVDLESRGERVGAVGPALYDAGSGRCHGFHRVEGLWWARVQPLSPGPLRCDGLNGSGTLISTRVFMDLGGLEEDLFIDHVDTEFSFRLIGRGLSLFGVPQSRFLHQMGEGSGRIWICGWRVWPLRQPLRHRFLFRNALKLMRRKYVPAAWKLWVLPKLALTLLVFAVSGPQRLKQVFAMLQGVVDASLGRGGGIRS